MRRLLALSLLAVLTACSSSPDTTTPGGAASVATVIVTPGTASLTAAQTVQLTATAKDSAGNALAGQTVTWSASPSTVATVSSSGLVTGVAAGTATITATITGKSGTAAITVSGLTEVNTVGATGGTVIADHGNVTLAFPAGAVSAPTPIAVTPLVPLPQTGFRFIGQPYELGPTGTQFPQPVALSMAYSPASLPAGTDQSQLRMYSLVGATWQETPTSSVDTVAHTVTAAISHFSPWAICEFPCYADLAMLDTDIYAGEFTMAAGTTYQLPVGVDEYGYTGPGTLSVTGLPAGITTTVVGSVTGPRQQLTVVFTAAVGQAGGIFAYDVHATAPGLPDHVSTWHVQIIGQNYSIAASPLLVPLSQGGTGTSALTVTRVGAFSGTLALSAEGLPSGVTAAFSPASVTGTSSTVTFTASASAQLGAAAITLRSKTTGYADQTIAMNLFVNPSNSASFTLVGTPPSINVSPGGTGSTGFTATRTNGFAGTITYTLGALPAGITATIAPTTSPDSMVLSVTAAASLALGSYPVTVTGTSGTIVQSAVIGVGVAAPGHLAVHLDYSGCAASTRPLWVAFEDGNASFTHVKGVADVYDFVIASPTAGIAVVTSGPSTTNVTYGTQAELAGFANHLTCNNFALGKTINVTTVSAPYSIFASIGGQFTTIAYPGDSGRGQIFYVALGAQNAIAFRLSPTPSVILRRNQNIADGGMLAPFDFTTPEAVTAANGLIVGVTPVFVENLYSDGAPACLFTPIYQSNSFGNTYYGIPFSAQQPGDLHQLAVATAGGVTAVSFFHTVTTQFLTVGQSIAGVGVTSISSPTYRRLATSFQLNGYRTATLSYHDGNNNNFLVTTTADVVGGSSANISAPDLSGVEGYLTSWAPSGPVQYNIFAASFDGFLTGPPCSDGFKYFTAQTGGAN